MNVVNLGEASYGKSGVAQALESYKNIKEVQIAKQNADTNEREQRSLEQYRPQELAQRKNQYALELAKMTQQEQEQNFQNGYKLLTDMSNKADTFPDETQKQMWETSEGYKELTKVVKKYLGPEFVSADGKVNYIGKQTRVEDQLKRVEGQLAQRISAVGFAGLTPQEKDMVKYFKNPGTEAIAKVYAAIEDDPEFQDAQAAGNTAKMAEVVQRYKRDIFPDEQYRGASPAPDPNDPMGLKKRSV